MRALDLKIISQRMVEKKWQPFAAPAPGWLVDKALWGGLRPEVQPVTLINTINFDGKGTLYLPWKISLG